jgi:hypothetical protein
MSRLTASNPPLYVVRGWSPAIGVCGKVQRNVCTYRLQLQDGGQEGTSSLQLSVAVNQKFAESAQDYKGKNVLSQKHRSSTILRGDAMQQTQ